MSSEKIKDSAENWENGQLGRDANFVKVSNDDGLDDILKMQLISIRFQKSLLEEIKLIANHNGVGYQTLIKQVLQRFTLAEIKKMAKELAAQNSKEEDCASIPSDENRVA